MLAQVLLIAIGIGWLVAALLLLQSWESLRFGRSRCESTVPGVLPGHCVGLLVPCKGHDLHLHENLTALFQQDHPNFTIYFIVEDESDPVFAVIRGLQSEFSKVSSRLVVAGLASHTGQKVHNLLAGIAVLDESVNVLAFVDSDAEPDPGWLRGLALRAEKEQCAAATGYRWFIPQKNTLANWLLYSANSATATLYGPGRHHLLWGGSWAILRETFDALGIADAWQDTLSDDLVASRAIHFANMGVAFEPRCMTASPIDATLPQATEFVRRQLVVGRRYANKHWWLTFAGLLFMQIALWGSFATGISKLIGGDMPAAATWLIATLAFWGATVIRSAWRQQLANIYVPQHARQLVAARRFDVWASSLSGTFLLFGFISSCFTRRITWRGNWYEIAASGRVQLLGRRSMDAGPIATKQAQQSKWRRAA